MRMLFACNTAHVHERVLITSHSDLVYFVEHVEIVFAFAEGPLPVLLIVCHAIHVFKGLVLQQRSAMHIKLGNYVLLIAS
jgi:hypothetical protein